MDQEQSKDPDLQPLKKWIHDLNNRVGVILVSAELLQMEELSPKANERARTIEQKAMELSELLRSVADHYFS